MSLLTKSERLELHRRGELSSPDEELAPGDEMGLASDLEEEKALARERERADTDEDRLSGTGRLILLLAFIIVIAAFLTLKHYFPGSP